MDADREIDFNCFESTYSDGHWFVTGRNCEDAIWLGDIFTALYRIVYPESKPNYNDDEACELHYMLRTKQNLREVSLHVVGIKMYRILGEESLTPSYTGQLELVGDGGELIRQGDMLSTLEIATQPIT